MPCEVGAKKKMRRSTCTLGFGFVVASVHLWRSSLHWHLEDYTVATKVVQKSTEVAIPYAIDPFVGINDRPSTFDMGSFKLLFLVDVDGRLLEGATLANNETIALSNVCQVFCRFPERSFALHHFPHFLQQAYPCWSLLQRFRPTGKHFYMVIPAKPLRHSQYIRSFLDAIKRSSLNVKVIYGNGSFSLHRDGCSDDSTSILATKAFSDTGWDRPVKYFMNHTADLAQLQKAVLGSSFRAGPSSLVPLLQTMNILILDRKGSTRDWVFATNAKDLFELKLGGDATVNYIETFSGLTLQKQAKAMHSADIIVSPHGAQLSNLVYIRPCTVVIELFPRNYYLQFYQALVVSANGVSYDGYPVGVNKVEETRTMLAGDKRAETRDVRILTSPVSILEALPGLISASSQCRSDLSYR